MPMMPDPPVAAGQHRCARQYPSRRPRGLPRGLLRWCCR